MALVRLEIQGIALDGAVFVFTYVKIQKLYRILMKTSAPLR
jgi:hypothetical protein